MTEFDVVGRRLRASALPEPVERWLRGGWDFPEYDLPRVPYSVTLEPGSPPAGLPAAAGATATLPGIELPCHALDECAWVLGGARSGVSLRLAPGDAHIAFWGEEVPYAALFLGVYEAVRASGLVPLHASVIARGGEATALMARSGTGKSSTLVSAIQAGWRPIAEDFAWLEPESLRLFGWDRGVHLWPEGRARFALDGWTEGSDGKLFLPWSAWGDAEPRAARLEGLALLVRDAERASAWEPLPAREAVRALWEAIGVPLSDDSRARVGRLVPALLGRIAARRLVLGATPLPLDARAIPVP